MVLAVTDQQHFENGTICGCAEHFRAHPRHAWATIDGLRLCPGVIEENGFFRRAILEVEWGAHGVIFGGDRSAAAGQLQPAEEAPDNDDPAGVHTREAGAPASGGVPMTTGEEHDGDGTEVAAVVHAVSGDTGSPGAGVGGEPVHGVRVGSGAPAAAARAAAEARDEAAGVSLPHASYIPEMSTEKLLELIEWAGRQIEEATNVAPDVYALYGRGVRMMAAELRKRGVRSAVPADA